MKCEQCHERFGNSTGLKNHWNLSTSCEWPQLTQQEAETFVGLWLAGGTVNNRDGKHSQIQYHHKDRDALEWVNDRLERWNGNVSEKGKHRYVIDTRRHPSISRLREKEMAAVTPTPGVFAVFYKLCGTYEDGRVRFELDTTVEMVTGETLISHLESVDCLSFDYTVSLKDVISIELTEAASDDLMQWITDEF